MNQIEPRVQDIFPDLIAVQTDEGAHLFRPASLVAQCGAAFGRGGQNVQDIRAVCCECVVEAAIRGAAVVTLDGPETGYEDDRVEGGVRADDWSDIADRLREEFGSEIVLR